MSLHCKTLKNIQCSMKIDLQPLFRRFQVKLMVSLKGLHPQIQKLKIKFSLWEVSPNFGRQ